MYPLVCHLLDAGQAARVVFDSVLTAPQRATIAGALTADDVDDARTLVTLVAAWHDIGKSCPSFQSQNEQAYADSGASPWTRGAARVPRHDLAGYWQFVDWMRENAKLTEVSSMVGQVIGGHHGVYSETLLGTRSGTDSATIAMHGKDGLVGAWQNRRDDIMVTVADLLLGDNWRPALSELTSVARTTGTPVAICLATATVIVSDWLVSDTEKFIDTAALPEHWTDEAARSWLAAQTPRVAARVHSAGITGPELAPRPIAEQFPSVGIVEPRGVQRFAVDDLADLGPGLVLLMAPTGDGKTEAGLHAASVLSGAQSGPGFLLALPTMATTNALFERSVNFCRHAFDDTTRITLMHSMAYCQDSYTRRSTAEARPPLLPGEPVDECVEAEDEGTKQKQALVEVTDWLRGYKRGLISPNTVCTIDQILTVAIASKWMPLPLMGVSRKVVIIDEVHAYDPHMQALLARLLTWLAACGTSVVAMSATLSQPSAGALVQAYRAGLPNASAAPVPPVSYPGWVHVASQTGAVAHGHSTTTRTRTTRIDLETYPKEQGFMEHTRLATKVSDVLSPILSGGDGNALVISNTVQSAVDVYESLRRVASARGDDLSIQVYHARFPNVQRSKAADRLTGLYGRDDALRPARSILVATQVAEQSLDIDFDVVVSDLAPAALLVQREGRGHRHTRASRPASFTQPRLVVLAEVDAQGALVRKDKRPYDHIDLAETWNALTALAGDTTHADLTIPADVQPLMKAVYDKPHWKSPPDLMTDRIAADSRASVAVNAARQKMIPAPAAVADLTRLTAQVDLSPEDRDYSARFDIDSIPVLPVWRDVSGALRMGSPEGRPIPAGPAISTDDVRAVVDQTISVSPGRWRPRLEALSGRDRPASWTHDRTLNHIAVLLMTSSDRFQGTADLELVELRLSTETGLTIRYNEQGNA